MAETPLRLGAVYKLVAPGPEGDTESAAGVRILDPYPHVSGSDSGKLGRHTRLTRRAVLPERRFLVEHDQSEINSPTLAEVFAQELMRPLID
jgi:hypothetical protein